MYKAIVKFVDLQDNNHVYHAGDVFPRDGIKVNEKRLNELLSDKNRKHQPVIEAVTEEVTPDIETPTLEELEPKPNKRGRRKNVK